MGEKRAKGRTDSGPKSEQSDECTLALHTTSMMEGVLSDLMEIIPCGCWHLTQSQSIFCGKFAFFIVALAYK
jgi:hypothetical protein